MFFGELLFPFFIAFLYSAIRFRIAVSCIVENIQQFEYNADSITKEISSIDEEILNTFSDLEKL